jgi:hypothetical protein
MLTGLNAERCIRTHLFCHVSDTRNRLFFQPHDAHKVNPAFRGASHCREQGKPCDTPGLTTAAKPSTTSISRAFNSCSLHCAAFTDANTRCPIDRIALRNNAPRKPGHFRRKPSICRIQDDLPHARIRRWRNRPALTITIRRKTALQSAHATPQLPPAPCHR